MKTSFLSLKKCLICLEFGILWMSLSATATIPLRETLSHRTSNQFSTLLKSLEDRYGTNAAAPLLQLANSSDVSDSDRYVALMACIRLGGKATAPWIPHFLKDRAWMMRSAALQALRILDAREFGGLAIPALNDPALVVRAEAVQTLKSLKPRGSAFALYRTLQDPRNYSGGRALYISKEALSAFAEQKLPSQRALVALSRVVNHPKNMVRDSLFKQNILKTIETLTGTPIPGNTLPQRIANLKSVAKTSYSR